MIRLIYKNRYNNIKFAVRWSYCVQSFYDRHGFYFLRLSRNRWYFVEREK